MRNSETTNPNRVTVELSSEILAGIDRIAKQLGVKSRGVVIARLLTELIVEESC